MRGFFNVRLKSSVINSSTDHDESLGGVRLVTSAVNLNAVAFSAAENMLTCVPPPPPHPPFSSLSMQYTMQPYALVLGLSESDNDRFVAFYLTHLYLLYGFVSTWLLYG